jgi:fluoroacetyl-CoA thioesterase
VGTRVEVSHLAATPVGRSITAFAEVTSTVGRHIEFRVWAMDQAEKIGAGTHARAVIELERLAERLAKKYANKGD